VVVSRADCLISNAPAEAADLSIDGQMGAGSESVELPGAEVVPPSRDLSSKAQREGERTNSGLNRSSAQPDHDPASVCEGPAPEACPSRPRYGPGCLRRNVLLKAVCPAEATSFVLDPGGRYERLSVLVPEPTVGRRAFT
jgi:hypothetical protein